MSRTADPSHAGYSMGENDRILGVYKGLVRQSDIPKYLKPKRKKATG